MGAAERGPSLRGLVGEGLAVLVVDLQNDFCAPEGALGRTGIPTDALAAVIPAVNGLTDQVRAAGGRVVYLRSVYSDARGRLLDAAMADQARYRWRGRGRTVPFLKEGHWGSELHADLAAEPGDRVFLKRSYNGFHANGLGPFLSRLGIRNVAVVGVTTDICVLFTSQAAFQRGHRVLVPRDCVAAYDGPRHEAALEVLDHAIGQVCHSADLVAAVRPSRARSAGGRR